MSDTTMHSAMGGVMDAVAAVANDAVKGAPRWVNAQAVLVSRLADLLAARDAEWRAAVERLKVDHSNGCERCKDAHECINESRAVFGNAALDALLAAMEGK